MSTTRRARPVRTVVVGVAGILPDDPRPRHPGEDPVLEPALELAASIGATLHVVHVFSLPRRVLAACGSVSRTQYAAELERLLRVQVAVYPVGVPVHCHALEGSAGGRLARFAAEREADLLIVGSSRRGQVWRGILGTTATEVLRTARVPVLVIHQPFTRPVERVLLAEDLATVGRRFTRRGLSLVEGLFPAERRRIRAVHVVSCDPLLPPPFPEWEMQLAAEQEMHRFAAENLASGGAAVEIGVRLGEPAVELTREAEEWQADLLVMGTQDPDYSTPESLGGTVTATLRHAGCNVLVVPTARAARRPARPRIPAAAHA